MEATVANEKKTVPADMPAGHSRDEAMKVVADELAEQGEKEFADVTSYSPDKLEVDNEIAQHYDFATDEFTVTDKVSGYVYLWNPANMRAHMEVMSRAARLLRDTSVRGFELVKGPKETYPECLHLKEVDGTRKVGDCQLYRIKEHVWAALVATGRMAAKAQEIGISSSLLERAARAPGYTAAHVVEGDPRQFLAQRAQRGGMPREQFVAEMVKTEAINEMARDMRSGNLHGMPVNKAVRR
jgi:hypothetical protein